MSALRTEHNTVAMMCSGQLLDAIDRVVLLRVKDEQARVGPANHQRQDAIEQGGFPAAGSANDEQMRQQILFVIQPDIASGGLVNGQMDEWFVVHAGE